MVPALNESRAMSHQANSSRAPVAPLLGGPSSARKLQLAPVSPTLQAVNVPISTPSEQGVAPESLSALLDAFEADPRIEPHGLIVQRHGHRILDAHWAPHPPGQIRHVYSLSKTFTGTALGLLLGEGRLGLDDLATDHFPELLAGAEDRTRRIRIRHLASMSSGHDRELMLEARAAEPDDLVAGFFRIPPDHEPGSYFAYSQPPVLALAALLQRLAGARLVEYLRPRLSDPLGLGEIRWDQYRPGVDLGFAGVYTTLDAVARLGQLYLDDGVWEDRRLLPEGWVAEASRVQVANDTRIEPDWRQGYGLLLWRCQHGYRGDGAFGQYMIVLPEQDMVIAFLSATDPMQSVLDHIWEVVLPSLRSPRASGAGDEALVRRLENLSLDTAAQRLGGSWSNSVRGRFTRGLGRSHPTVTGVEVNAEELVLEEGDSALHLPLSQEWSQAEEGPFATSATVDREGRLVVDLVFTATPHRIQVKMDPADNTFRARWRYVPLFIGADHRLASLRPPD
jgi:CubicO group peptidase (beta-lactamase class C family)